MPLRVTRPASKAGSTVISEHRFPKANTITEPKQMKNM
jgi:hypothetical protein